MRYNHFDMLPEKAFIRKAGGGILPQGGGSGTPTQTTSTTASIPAYAQPYVESTLGQTAALTDINQNPYQPYTGQRYADFTPLQQQAFQGIAGMQPAQQLGMATDLASQYGTQAGGIGQQYASQVTNPGAVSSYMSPYMQNVVDLQKQEANRAYDITGAKTMGQGVAAGAFGGSRDALMRAENERNRNTTLANIQAQGTQSAYDKAIQSMQYGSNLGLQGLQAGLQGAGVLGGLGNLQYQQGMGINQAQQAAGAQQQAQAQRPLDFAYQQYQESLNYPYKQLGFMSDVMKGLPLSQQSQSIYQNPSLTSQLAGLGTAAYGLYKMFGDGGEVKGGDGIDTLGMYNAMKE